MADYTFTKDPEAVLDYHFDWSAWLSDGETISSSTFESTAGITIDSNTTTATVATVWLSGGIRGRLYEITNHIVTNQGREDDRSITIRVKDR
ncbi:hypothetical protein [Rhodococcus sp. 11-3]|uniref:phage fiber-tail adaptor protein n=1 Tax=Rhodococcus sp. 11-3 TaxID=2854796 RepID=UPI00203CF3EC|nr:hypothetical protein [Rhodococcus sp. 11-3]USC17024.1 hypothetical protein KZJ41_09230 [Rhodococcus sp. 11-3]